MDDNPNRRIWVSNDADWKPAFQSDITWAMYLQCIQSEFQGVAPTETDTGILGLLHLTVAQLQRGGILLVEQKAGQTQITTRNDVAPETPHPTPFVFPSRVFDAACERGLAVVSDKRQLLPTGLGLRHLDAARVASGMSSVDVSWSEVLEQHQLNGPDQERSSDLPTLLLLEDLARRTRIGTRTDTLESDAGVRMQTLLNGYVIGSSTPQYPAVLIESVIAAGFVTDSKSGLVLTATGLSRISEADVR